LEVDFGGWLADLVHQHQCGIQYHPLRPEEMWQKITPYLHHEDLLQQAQVNARSLAEQEFSKQELLEGLIAVIEGRSSGIKESQAYTLSA